VSTTGVFGMDAFVNGKATSADSGTPSTVAMTGVGAGFDGGSCCGVTQTAFNTAAGIGIIGAA
jgi:hypothetical protein